MKNIKIAFTLSKKASDLIRALPPNRRALFLRCEAKNLKAYKDRYIEANIAEFNNACDKVVQQVREEAQNEEAV